MDEHTIDKLIKLVDAIGEAQNNPEVMSKIGKMLTENPELLGGVLNAIITEVTILKHDNEKHKANSNALFKMSQVANHNDIALQNQINELKVEIETLKLERRKKTDLSQVCGCGHMAGEHTGNGNCSQCDCKIFKSKGGGR